MIELLKLLTDLRPDVDFETEEELITGGILDSLDVVTLIDELDNKYGIEIKPNQILAENFDSMEKIYALVTSIKSE